MHKTTHQPLLTCLVIAAFALGLAAGCTTKSKEDPSDLRVITVTPANGQSNVATSSIVTLRFSEPVDHQTVIGTQQIILADQSNSVVPVSYQFQGEYVILTPGSPLAASATYGVAVRPGVRDIYGNNIAQPHAIVFSTGSSVGSIPNWPPFTWNPPIPPPSFPRGTFTMVGQLNVPRMRHRDILLDSGKVLIAGGLDAPATTAATRTAEVYNPTTRTWALSQSNNGRGMHYVRYDHTMVKLTNGHVLVCGGGDNVSIWDTCEEYNPLTDSFAIWSARLQTPRAGHSAVVLQNGYPIVIGGVDNTGAFRDDYEVFDYGSGNWVLGQANMGNMNLGRAFHTTTALADGKLLNCGSNYNNADIYDPGQGIGTNGTAVTTGTMMAAGRTMHTATRLQSGYGAGMVIIIGGYRYDFLIDHAVNFAEIYDHTQSVATPQFGSGTQGVFGAVGQCMFFCRHGHTANLLSNGTILVVGGYTSTGPNGQRAVGSEGDTAEIMDPFGLGYNINAPFAGINMTTKWDWTRNTQGNQTRVPNVFTGIAEHTATTMQDGTVLIAGGQNSIGPNPIVSGGSYVYMP